MKKILIVKWHQPLDSKTIDGINKYGYEIVEENHDGYEAYKAIINYKIYYVIFFLDKLPSHSKETARVIRNSPKGRKIPFIFIIDNTSTNIDKIREEFKEDIFCSLDEIFKFID